MKSSEPRVSSSPCPSDQRACYCAAAFQRVPRHAIGQRSDSSLLWTYLISVYRLRCPVEKHLFADTTPTTLDGYAKTRPSLYEKHYRIGGVSDNVQRRVFRLCSSAPCGSPVTPSARRPLCHARPCARQFSILPPHTPYRCAPTPTRGRPDSENARPADANLEASTGYLVPYGHTGGTAGSGSNMSCCPSGQTLRKSDLRSISALSTSLNWRTTGTRYRDTTAPSDTFSILGPSWCGADTS